MGNIIKKEKKYGKLEFDASINSGQVYFEYDDINSLQEQLNSLLYKNKKQEEIIEAQSRDLEALLNNDKLFMIKINNLENDIKKINKNHHNTNNHYIQDYEYDEYDEFINSNNNGIKSIESENDNTQSSMFEVSQRESFFKSATNHHQNKVESH